MKPILIKHADGSGETAYVQDPGQAESKKCTPTQKLHKNLIVVYLLVGTISLALSAYATIRLLHKK